MTAPKSVAVSSSMLLVLAVLLTPSVNALALSLSSGFDLSKIINGNCTLTASKLHHKATINCNPTTTTEFLTFVECSGTNGNHNVHCTVHDSGITDINCIVANPAISGGNNVGDCTTNNGVHLTCVIPPQPGVFPCTRQT